MKSVKIFNKIILINKASRRSYCKKIIAYFSSIFSILFFLKEIFEIAGISNYSFTQPIVIFIGMILIVLIASIIAAYFHFKKYCKRKYKIGNEKYIELRVGDYVENARQLIEEDKKSNLENKVFFIFGVNNGFQFDVVAKGSLQYDFTKEFFIGGDNSNSNNNYQEYQSLVNDFFTNNNINHIGKRIHTYDNCQTEYFLYDFGTICEIKFPLNESRVEDRFPLLLFADSMRNDNANFLGDIHVLSNIKKIWEYMHKKGYTNRRILFPILGTGCANSITHKKSITAIIDAFFDDINNNSIPAFKEIIISIHPDKVGSNVDLLEIERYIELKKLIL